MYQVFESLKIALAAIWANKLRSFLTVLGNIVAVTSIIAVVSLVQGIDDYVANAIETELGVGTFTVQRWGMIRSEEEFEKVVGNPDITERDATAVRDADLVRGGDDQRRGVGRGAVQGPRHRIGVDLRRQPGLRRVRRLQGRDGPPHHADGDRPAAARRR